MNQNLSEALERQGSSMWRWAGAVFAAAAMVVGVAPATAADVQTLSFGLVQNPNPANYEALAAYTVTLTNTSGKTVNNAVLTVVAPAGTLVGVPLGGITCSLSTGATCATPVNAGTTYQAGGYQLPAGGRLTMRVGYYMPPASASADSFFLTVTGTSSNNVTGPASAAYTPVTVKFPIFPSTPPPAYPSVNIAVQQLSTVLWSTAACTSSSTDRDCGATYYGQYSIKVSNADQNAAISKIFKVALSSNLATFAGSDGCASPCESLAPVSDPLNPNFTISGLAAAGTPGDSTTFTVFFQSPVKPADTSVVAFNVTATATIDNVVTGEIGHFLAATPVTTTPDADAAVGTYMSVVPPQTGGSVKTRNELVPQSSYPNNGPFSSRLDVPKAASAGASKIDVVLNVAKGTVNCSSWSPLCLETEAFVTSNQQSVTFGSGPLNGSQLVITMVREYTTLNKKPSSVFNATVWYTDDAGNRTAIKNCGSVNLTTADRCVAQRIDATTSDQTGYTGGYIKLIIWARHNGRIGW